MIRVMRRRKKCFHPFPSLSFFYLPSHLTTSTSSNLFHFFSVSRLLFLFWFLKVFSQVYENIRTFTFSLKNSCKKLTFFIDCRYLLQVLVKIFWHIKIPRTQRRFLLSNVWLKLTFLCKYFQSLCKKKEDNK
jgi:hypothetical protein